MVQGTTPTLTFNVTGYTFPDDTVYVYINQMAKVITKSGDDVSVVVDGENSTVSVVLTQQETLSLAAGAAEAQIRSITSGGIVVASDVIPFTITKILKSEVLSNG